MRYLQQHIKDILASYDGRLPLSHFLKNHFRKYPKLGSRDRKALSTMAYTWYRYSKGFAADHYNRLNELLDEPKEWNSDRIGQWIKAHSSEFDADKLFPYDLALSEGITRAEWLESVLTQPQLFIRIRKDKDKIMSLLDEQQIPATLVTDDCVSLPNGARIDALLPEDCYVVQDASSQQTGAFFNARKNELWYDCCSGAGGKSILLKDLQPGVRLTVSDKRPSIIHNLQQRFRQYHLEQPRCVVADAADTDTLSKTLENSRFDNIICDVPCSGSGTWARTPEQLYFFNPAQLKPFPPLQRAIAINVHRYLKPGGRLIYITCSIFRQENEDAIAAILHNTGMSLLRSQIINGIRIHADSMFIAEFRNIKTA